MNDSVPNTKFDRPDHLIENKSLRDIVADLRKAEVWLILAAIAAFLASVFFVVKYFAGGVMDPLVWTGEQWANATLALGITAVITAAQAFLYASGYKGTAAIVATCIVVFFGIFSEVSQSMEREDATVRYRSENSPVFKAALGSIGSLTATAGSITSEQKALADAQGKLNYWLQLKTTKQANANAVKTSFAAIDRNLARYQQQVNSLEHQTNLQGENRTTLLTGAIAQAKALEYDEDKHYAMIRLIRNVLGVQGIWASFLFSLIIISTFEYAFHFVGVYVADHRRALWLLGRDSQGHFIHPATDTSSSATANDGSIYAELRSHYSDWVKPERTGTPKPVKNAAKTQGQEATKQTETLTTKPTVELVKPPFLSAIDPSKSMKISDDQRAEPLKAPVRDLTRERLFKLIYSEIRTRIINDDLKPTVRPVTEAVTDVIRHHTKALGLQPALIGKPERQKIAEKILEKLEKEMVLELNAEQGIGKAKYVLAKHLPPLSVPELSITSQLIR